MVQQNDGAIGYVELAYAKQNKLPMASLQNKAGAFVDGRSRFHAEGNGGFRRRHAQDSGPVHRGCPGHGFVADRRLHVPARLHWISRIAPRPPRWSISSGGGCRTAPSIATELDYVPLPDAVKAQVLARLGELTCQGKPIIVGSERHPVQWRGSTITARFAAVTVCRATGCSEDGGRNARGSVQETDPGGWPLTLRAWRCPLPAHRDAGVGARSGAGAGHRGSIVAEQRALPRRLRLWASSSPAIGIPLRSSLGPRLSGTAPW